MLKNSKTEYIKDEKMRKLTFKKRRINWLKKAIQLSIVSDCEISLQVYWKEDGSLVEFYSADNAQPQRKQADVLSHAKFSKKNYDLCENIDHLTSQHGHMFLERENESGFHKKLYREIEGFNLL